MSVLLCCGPSTAEESIRLMTEEFPPFQYYDSGRLTGISIDIVQALQQKIGNSDSIRVYPWTRGLRLLESKPNSALFSTMKTPERKSRYKWVGPLAELRMVFFKKKGSPIQLKSVDDAKKISKIGVTKNVGAHELLLGLGFGNLDVLESGADESNIKKLIRNRIDLWPTSYFAGLYSAKKMGYEGQIEPIKGVNIMSGHLFVAFNKDTDDAIISRWQTALDALRSEGVIDKMMKKYQ